MSLFSIVQGRVPPKVPAPQPTNTLLQPLPTPSPVPAPQATGPNIPAFANGGFVVSGYEHGGYHSVSDMMNDVSRNPGMGDRLDNMFLDTISGQFQTYAGTAPAVSEPPLGPEYYDWAYGRGLDPLDPEVKAAWWSMSGRPSAEQLQASSGGGGGAGYDPRTDAINYARLAEEARQWNEKLAFERASAEQANRIAQVQAQQENAFNVENLINERKRLQQEAAQAQLSAITANIPQGYVPGVQDWQPYTQNDKAPKPVNYKLDPGKVMGQPLQNPNIPAPVIPDARF